MSLFRPGCLFVLAAVLASPALSEPSATPTSTEVVHNGDMNTGHSIAPVVGYEPTYKLVVGAAYFYQQPENSFSIDANLNFRNVYQLHSRWTQRLYENWELGFSFGATKGFDPYYGEGAATRVEDRIQLFGLRSTAHLQLLRNLGSLVSFGIFGDVRVRTETGDGKEPFVRHFPNETTGALGFVVIADTRNNKQDPTEGFTLLGQVSFVPASFSTVKTTNYVQIEGGISVYKEILQGAIPNVIAAFRVMGGHTFGGDPTYMYRYRLGGSDQLQGYLENRFRGKRYYMQQTELRLPIWRMISAATFVSFGDATDTSFTNPRMAYGVGVRVGLPPDWVSKVRIDVAWGQDEYGVFADYGQSF